MPAATVTPTEYGYEITGDTGATTINAGTLRVKALAFAGDNNNDTCALTTVVAGTAVSCYKFKVNSSDNDPPASYVYFGEKGVPMTGLTATLNDADNILYVFIR